MHGHRKIMFNWFAKRSINTSKASEILITRTPLSNLPIEVDIADKSIAYKNSGDMHLDRREFKEAVARYLQAIAIRPNYAAAYNNLGNAYREQNLFEDAEFYLNQAIKIKPDLANVYYNLASLQLQQGRLNEAIENFSEALKHEPKHYAAQAIMLNLLQKTCSWHDLDANILTLRREATAPADSPINIFSPFAFIALPGSTNEEQKICAEKWTQFEYHPLVSLRNNLGFNHSHTHNSKIKIGYLSADFRQHPVSLLMAEVFELHDHGRFNITAYSYGSNDYSATRQRLERSFSNFVDIQNDSIEDAAKKIYTDQIDILIDLTGHTQNSRSAILALRPAPIQVNYLGYPGTMGADFIDYIIADQFVIPPEHQEYYTETVIRLPDCFMPSDRTRPRLAAPSRKDCGLPSDGFVFCCFNQSYKITPEIFDIWCNLLKAVPDSVLWLQASNPQAQVNLKREAENRGVSAKRIFMAARMPTIDAHLARMQCADLFLDTTPYNAHATCSDALWMCLPLITCMGETFPSRVAGSLLFAMGVPELITYNLKDYYHLALEFATDKGKLDAIRNKIIANRDAAPLFDSALFTRNLENAYIQMMAEHSKKICLFN